jgi:DNA anti-recombination protein RmuC
MANGHDYNLDLQRKPDLNTGMCHRWKVHQQIGLVTFQALQLTCKHGASQVEELQGALTEAHRDLSNTKTSLQQSADDAKTAARAELHSAHCQHAQAMTRAKQELQEEHDAALSKWKQEMKQQLAEKEAEHEAAMARVAEAAAAELRETKEQLLAKVVQPFHRFLKLVPCTEAF